MRQTWRWLKATAAEQAAFAGPDAVLALPFTDAGPPNRLRSVRRLQLAGASYYLKLFTRTQWKNRLRFRCTAPRATDDAGREAAMTQALARAGIEVPRPLAVGRRGAASFYLCAALPGRALGELLSMGATDAAMVRATARFCGNVLARGFRLPDLSADHVFVRRELGLFHFGLLDLHNAGIGPPGPPPLGLCARVLRRFARSARLLPIPAGTALRFAVGLLRSAGRGAEVRQLLRRLPPFDTAARYDGDGRSARYHRRNPSRDAREQALLARVWPGRPGQTVLDAPCGAGRLLPLLRDRLGARLLWADAALAMLREARAAHWLAGPPPALQADALRLPLADGSVDGVVLFRFLHHLPPEHARRAVAEACRVARRFVVLTFFHPCSAHHLRRRLRRLGGGRSTRFALTLGRLRRWCHAHGFRLQARAADLPFLRDLWVASFVREPARGPFTPGPG